MNRVLHLTTGHMHGPDVLSLQRLLSQSGFLKSDPTGEYDVMTAQAVYRAMHWLGYRNPSQELDRPGLLMSYLAGQKKQSVAMRGRAKVRGAGRRPETAGQRVVQVACSQIGTKENPPDSNRVMYSLWYGVIGAWCAMFVTWVFLTAKVGWRTFIRARRYSYVPNIVHDAEQGVNGLMVAGAPASGIVACFDWDRDGTADHVGICADAADLFIFVPAAFEFAKKMFGDLGPGEFWTVEGNTAVGNDSNGGEVQIRKRNISEVRRFCRVAN